MVIYKKLHIHGHKYSKWLIYAIVFSCSLLLLAIPIHISINAFDEGTILNNAFRISLGNSPYLDFWTGYMPGQYYAVSFLFKLFGPSVLVERWWDILIRALFLLELFIFSWEKFKIGNSLFVWLIAALLMAGSGSYGNPLYPALFWSLTAILMTDYFFRSNKRAWIFVAGLSIGFAIWYRWDFGLYAGIADSLALFLFLKSTSIGQNDALRKALKTAGIFVSGVMIACLLLVGLILIQGVLKEFIDQVFIFPVTVMQSFRRKPFPSLSLPIKIFTANGGMQPDQLPDLYNWIFFYFPILLSFFFAMWVFSGLRKRASSPQFFSWMAFGSFGLLLMTYSLSRFDYPHALPVSLFVCPITILLLESVEKFQHGPYRTIVFPLAVIILSVCYTFFPAIVLTNAFISYSPFRCFSNFPKAQCVYLDPDQIQVIRYIDSVTDDDDAIFIGNSRHDQILTNDLSLYFLVGQPGGTSYYALEPGIATTYKVQNEIITDLQQNQVQWIVLVDSPLAAESNLSAISSHVYLLDIYIDQHYRLITSFGRFTILQAIT